MSGLHPVGKIVGGVLGMKMLGISWLGLPQLVHAPYPRQDLCESKYEQKYPPPAAGGAGGFSPIFLTGAGARSPPPNSGGRDGPGASPGVIRHPSRPPQRALWRERGWDGSNQPGGGPTRPAAEMRGFLSKGSRVVDGFLIFFDVLARNQVLCTGLPDIWWIAPVDLFLKLFRVENRKMRHLARI